MAAVVVGVAVAVEVVAVVAVIGVVVVVVEVELAVTSGEKFNHRSHDLLRVGSNDFELKKYQRLETCRVSRPCCCCYCCRCHCYSCC